jgi:hypothetical protein
MKTNCSSKNKEIVVEIRRFIISENMEKAGRFMLKEISQTQKGKKLCHVTYM